MSEVATGSTVPRRQLGRYLRDLRGKARLTVRAAAQELEWSEAKIWRIETGQTSLRSLDVEAMCKIYGADDEFTEVLKALAKETKGKGWWHAYGDVIPEGFDLYVGLEEAAASLTCYQTELVPGLLQTEDYARALIRFDNPNDEDDEVERRVRLRMERQSLLTRVTAPPTLDIVLNEAILRRPVGSPQIMAAQLNRIMGVGELPNVMIRVVPFTVGLHAGVLSGPFVILRFPLNGDGRATEPPTIYVDGYTGALYLDKPHEIERYETGFEAIQGAALDVQDSKALILKAAEELVT